MTLEFKVAVPRACNAEVRRTLWAHRALSVGAPNLDYKVKTIRAKLTRRQRVPTRPLVL